MTENGNSTFFGLILLMILTILGLNFYSIRLNNLQHLKDKQELLLCTKELNGETRKYVKEMEYTNDALAAATAGKVIPIPNPIIRLAFSFGVEALKTYQNNLGISFMKIKQKLSKKSCLNPFYLITNKPYKSIAGFYKRNKLNQAIKVGKKWKISLRKGKYRITNTYFLRGKKLSIKSKIRTARFFSILL